VGPPPPTRFFTTSCILQLLARRSGPLSSLMNCWGFLLVSSSVRSLPLFVAVTPLLFLLENGATPPVDQVQHRQRFIRRLFFSPPTHIPTAPYVTESARKVFFFSSLEWHFLIVSSLPSWLTLLFSTVDDASRSGCEVSSHQ